MHDTLRRLHGGRRASDTTIDHFRLNEAVSQIAFGGRRGRVYRRIVALTGARPGDCVLDVGCSGGYLARKLADAVGPAGRVVGVDPSKTAIAYAQRHAGPGMSFTTGAAQDLPLLDSSFDAVTCTLAMHHIPARKRADAFAEMHRVTKPGGRLLVADFDPSRRPVPQAGRRGRVPGRVLRPAPPPVVRRRHSPGVPAGQRSGAAAGLTAWTRSTVPVLSRSVSTTWNPAALTRGSWRRVKCSPAVRIVIRSRSHWAA